MSWSHAAFEEPATPLITTAQAKAHLRLTGTADDTYIDTLVLSATYFAQRWTGARFYEQLFTEFQDAFPEGKEMQLHLYPVSGSLSVRYRNSDGDQITIDSSDYYEHVSRTPPIIEIKGSWPSPGPQTNGVLVLGTAGYTTCPPDVLHALKLIVGHWFETPEDTGFTMPAAAKALLTQHRLFR